MATAFNASARSASWRVVARNSHDEESPRLSMAGPFGTLLVTPLILACAEADEERVNSELSKAKGKNTLEKALREHDDWAGSTPLHWAAYAGCAPAVRALLEAGADPNLGNTRDGALPLHLAARYNKDTAAIEILVNAAASTVNAVSAKGNTPLHETAYEGRVATAAVLLHKGAMLEAVNQSTETGDARGLTPLLVAVQYGHIPLMRLLLAAGANPSPPVPSSSSDDGSFSIPGQAALALSLNHARLPATLCLLDFFASVHGFFPPLFTRVQLQRIITRLWVAPATEDEALALKDTIHLFTVLVLCTRPDGAPPLEALSGDIGDQRTAATNLLLHEQHHAPNPVLVALKLASHCRDAMALNARDRAISEQLSTAANLLENVASGVLHGAVRATIERDEMKKTFNPWVTGKRALEPRVARDFFTTSTLHHAAEHELKVFVSNPFIYSHLQDLFWPEPPSGGIGNTPSTTPGDAGSLLAIASEVKPGGAGGVVGTSRRQLLRMSTSRNVMIPMSADVNPSGPGDEAALSPLLRWVRDACTYAALLLAHVLVLPVLLVIPRHWEVAIEDQQRQMVTSRQIPFGIIWFFPAGHIALWTAATTALAYLLTILPPPVIDDAVGRSSGSAALALVLGSHHDALLFFYLLGWCVFELQDLLSTNARATYFRDVFNMVDLALIVGMCLTFVTRLATPDNLYLTLPCQAATAMFAWLRLLQVLYIFPTTGPLLIMTIRMFRDLYQFLILAAFVIIAFAAAFHVLLNGEAVVEAWEAAASTPRASVSPSASEVLATASLEPPAASDRRMLKGGGSIAMGVHLGGRMPDGSRDPITFGAVIRLMLEGTLTGEPDRIMGLHSGADHALASFTWSTMALFGVVVVLLLLNLLIARFAKTFDIVYENVDANFKVAFARIVLKGGAHELVPPPFNLVRRAVLFLYTVVGQLVRRLPCRIAYLPLLEEDDDEELSEHGLSREEVGRIWEFMRKASSQQVQLYPAMVEKWVVRHQHDVASEDRWRTAITQQLALISAQVKDIHGDQESSRGRLDSAAQDEVATARAEAAAAQADSSNARRELEALKLQLLELRAQQPRSQRSQRGTKTTSFADSSTRPRDGSSADGAGGTQSPPLEASCVSA